MRPGRSPWFIVFTSNYLQHNMPSLRCSATRRDATVAAFFFSVLSSLHEDVQAVIGWGWEDKEFYVKWMGDNDPIVIEELKGPALNLASPQSNLAPALLDLFREVLLPDTAYLERVKRHYAMFRERIDGKRESTGPKNMGRRRKKIKPEP